MVLRRAPFFGLIILAVTSACSGNSGVENGNSDSLSVSVKSGKTLYDNNCMACHGQDGSLGAGGAFDLRKSGLSKSGISDIIKNGRSGMPPQSHAYRNEEELDSLISYVLTLREK